MFEGGKDKIYFEIKRSLKRFLHDLNLGIKHLNDIQNKVLNHKTSRKPELRNSVSNCIREGHMRQSI